MNWIPDAINRVGEQTVRGQPHSYSSYLNEKEIVGGFLADLAHKKPYGNHNSAL